MPGKQKIRTKLLFSYLSIILFIVTISGIMFQQIQGIGAIIQKELPPAVENIRDSSNLDSLSQAIKYYDEVLTQSARNYAFTGKEQWKNRYIQIVPLLDDAIKNAIDLGDKDDKKFFSGVDKANLALIEIEEQALEAVNERDQDKAITLLESNRYWELKDEYKGGLENYVQRRGKNYEEVLTVTSAHVEELLSALKLHSVRASFIFSVIAIISVFGAVSFSFFMSTKITGPLRQLQKATDDVGNSEETKEIIVNSKDEIQDLANSFNLMVKRLGETTVSKDYVNNIIQSMIDALIVVDSREKIKMVNQATCDLLGYTEKELLGKDLSLLLPKKEGISFEDTWFQKLTKGSSDSIRDYEMTYKTKNGKSIPINFSGSVLMDKDDKLVGVVGVARDMREIQHLMEEEKKHVTELERSNKELEEFAYIASHDLQEPLRKVKTFGDRLIQKYGEAIEGQGKDYLQRMDSATNRMQALINDLLTYSRVTSKAQPFAPVNLNSIVGEVLSDLEVKIEEVDAQIRMDDLPTIEADAMQMRQLFQNLIGNALKFCKPEVPPVIEIRSTLESTLEDILDKKSLANECSRIITITDNGIGFEEKYKEQIFSVFQRLHGRKEYEGTGIGLAVCQKIVTRHGGTVKAESTPDEGATFTITLPIIQPKEKRKEWHDESESD